MATDDDAEPFRRLPWQAESPSAVRLKRITMIRIFRLRSAGFPCSVGNQQPRAGATLAFAFLTTCFEERTLPNYAPTTTRAALAHQTGLRRGS